MNKSLIVIFFLYKKDDARFILLTYQLDSLLMHCTALYQTVPLVLFLTALILLDYEKFQHCIFVYLQGCSSLPLCSPCRGIFVTQFFFMDVDLWIKEEKGSDKQLFSGYVEFDTSLAGFGYRLSGRFQGECHGLDMRYALLGDGIETVIEVKAEAKQPSDVRISASTSGFDDEISLYDGKFCGSGSMFKHIVAVKKRGELRVVLKMGDYTYKWTFKAGVGVVLAPEHPVSGFTEYFVMNVSFRTRGKKASAWQWSCICNHVCVSKSCL